ncbi:hypothetical protein HPP92_026296 [Vanilla planifolia]|uniref:Uncharacterized protein n=1 Tax=Vanilla planifolia TaxID=51239 RepID=A0A835U6C2_VANPL|nr:hypothetical protein HPP92_026524 [Vanilla planifolia]KAG0451271.1 hypothetical protein HPP92_026296 [Vanilla planifolia]
MGRVGVSPRYACRSRSGWRIKTASISRELQSTRNWRKSMLVVVTCRKACESTWVQTDSVSQTNGLKTLFLPPRLLLRCLRSRAARQLELPPNQTVWTDELETHRPESRPGSLPTTNTDATRADLRSPQAHQGQGSCDQD